MTSLRPFIWFLVVPFLMMSVGYALFSQNLQIGGTARTVAQDSNGDPNAPNLTVSATRSIYGTGPFQYQFNVTISNIGAVAATGWEVRFNVPTAVTGLSCWNASCQLSSLTLIFENASHNGAIPPGGSTSFGVQFTSTNGTLTFNDAIVIGESGAGPDSQYQVVSGLTATMTPGTGWTSGGKYIRQYSITVRNNTGQRVKGWRIYVTNWNSTTHTVESIWSATYISEPTVLKMTNGSQLENNATFSFGGQIGMPSSSWAPIFEVRGKV
ncbi:MAG TPA: cellulose binding domain-containing protein [Candidatus Saccharibacteria bacterium]|nr:cellulose binding domain-containing protein [Candidatus Saccharibacteria bacterium]